MSHLRLARDLAVFAPCYIALDWASYIDPLGPFNITPWNPQPALAIVWMMLAGLRHAPFVAATIFLADVVIRHVPGGYAIAIITSLILAGGYALIAWALRALLRDTSLRSTRQLTFFVAVVIAGTCAVGAAFVGALYAWGLLRPAQLASAWPRFWIGDAVGILVTAPLLFAAADAERRRALLRLFARPEALLQIAVLAATVWLIFSGMGTDPSRHFYLLFLPLIWSAVRFGMNGAIVATAVVQLGVVVGIHGEAGARMPVVELQALMASLTLTGLFLGVMVDQRQRAEEGLRQSLRLAAAGEMAGAIAHEVNQPLTAVANYGRAAQMLLEQPACSAAQLQQTIAKILSEADRAAEVVRRLRDFFRAGTTKLELVPAAEFIRIVRQIGSAEIDSRAITLEVEHADPLPPLFVDRLQIEVVLRNLLANAVDSLGVSSRNGARISVRIEPCDDAHVRVVVVDNGPGIPPAARESVFEPFVSGKPSGMGLGLAVSRAIAEAHGGTLQAAANGHGEFHLTLPCAQNA